MNSAVYSGSEDSISPEFTKRNHPLDYGTECSGYSTQRLSPVSSCMSMESDRSMDPPNSFCKASSVLSHQRSPLVCRKTLTCKSRSRSACVCDKTCKGRTHNRMHAQPCTCCGGSVPACCMQQNLTAATGQNSANRLVWVLPGILCIIAAVVYCMGSSQLQEEESTLQAAEWKLLKVDMPEDNNQPKNPKHLFVPEDEDSDTNCEIPRKKKPKLATQTLAEEEILSEDNQPNPGIQSPERTSSTECCGQVRELQNQVKALQEENTRLHLLVVKEIPSLLADMKRVQPNNPNKDLQPEVGEGESERETKISKPSDVKLGKEGNTTVSTEIAKPQAVFVLSEKAKALVKELFKGDAHLKSRLQTGGVNKVNPTAERRQLLDGYNTES